MAITFEHWLVCDDPVCNPNLVTYRLMKITALVSDVIEYDKSPPDSIYDMDLYGDFEVLDYQDVDINSGEVPERIVDMHCNELKDKAVNLCEEYEEAYLSGKLPAWDSRVLNVIKSACKEGIESCK